MFPHLLTLKPLLKISPMTSHKNINKIETLTICKYSVWLLGYAKHVRPGARKTWVPTYDVEGSGTAVEMNLSTPHQTKRLLPNLCPLPETTETKTKNRLNYAEQILQEYKRIRVLLAGWCLNEQPNISVGLANLIVIWFRWIRKDWGVVLLSLEMGKVVVIPLREKSYFDEVALNRFGPLRT